MNKKRFIAVLLILISIILISCEEEQDLDYPILTILHSSDLETGARLSRAAAPPDPPVLTNISGQMNAVLFPVDGEPYAYTVYTANEERGPVAIEGCLFEEFDLSVPVEWSHNAGDLQGSGGDSSAIALYGKYYDFTFTYDSSEYTVRVSGGNVAPYQKGDLLIADGGVFKWYDTDSSSLVAETETRPSSVKQLADARDKSFLGDMILIPISISIANEDGTTSVFVDETISAVDIDIDLSSFSVTVGSTPTAESIIQNFYVDFFLDANQGASATAKVAFENDNVLSDDDDDEDDGE